MDNREFKSYLIAVVVGVLIGLFMSWCTRPKSAVPSVRVERDTVYRYDTVPEYLPKAKDSSLVRWMVVKVPFERPPQSGDTVYRPTIVTNTVRDTIEVELPLTQKHYQSENYQAWVSGYRPNLDSIEVYQKTNTITETITITQKAKTKHWGIGFTGGYGYDFNSKTAGPYVGVGVSYNLITF